MDRLPESGSYRSRYSPALRAAAVAAVVLMGNLNALVDLFLHPEIPYLDEEHLIVGGLTALLSGALIVLASVYLRRYRSAQRKIQSLESLLPICAHCKKIRTSGGAERGAEAWNPVEAYFNERDGVSFTHSVCPECERVHYAEPDSAG